MPSGDETTPFQSKMISLKNSEQSIDSDKVFNPTEFRKAAEEQKPIGSPRMDVGIYQRDKVE